MKALIWFLCFLTVALIQMLVADAGIILGGIPTALLAALAFFVAKKLCFKLDLHRLAKKAKAKGMTLNELVKKATKPEILAQCESMKDKKELKHYLDRQLELGAITDLHVKVLFDHYK